MKKDIFNTTLTGRREVIKMLDRAILLGTIFSILLFIALVGLAIYAGKTLIPIYEHNI